MEEGEEVGRGTPTTLGQGGGSTGVLLLLTEVGPTGGRGRSHQVIFIAIFRNISIWPGPPVGPPVKEEPGLDMSGWSHQPPGYQVAALLTCL